MPAHSDRIDDRVDRLEDTTHHLITDLKVTSNEISTLKAAVHKIGDGVSRLLERESRRPDALTAKTVVATLLATGTVVGMTGTFVWWLIAASPAFEGLDRRLSRLDDPEVGKVSRIEEHLRTSSPGWTVNVTRADQRQRGR